MRQGGRVMVLVDHPFEGLVDEIPRIHGWRRDAPLYRGGVRIAVAIRRVYATHEPSQTTPRIAGRRQVREGVAHAVAPGVELRRAATWLLCSLSLSLA